MQLRGERGSNGGPSQEGYLRVERPHGRFNAEVTLPPSVDVEGIRATHRNGVIEITLPKKRPTDPNSIEITTH